MDQQAAQECAYCGLITPVGDGDPERGSIFSCEACGKTFCTCCFESKTGLTVGEFMQSSRCLCPDCRGIRMKRYGVTFSRYGYAEVDATNKEEAKLIADQTIKEDEVSWDDDWPAANAELIQ